MNNNTQIFSRYTTIALQTLALIISFNFAAFAQSTNDYKTYTQEEWGANKGNRTFKYLHKNFDSAFPQGLEIGCIFKVKFTNAEAISNFLPSKGEPKALTQSYTNPDSCLNNGLISQILALKLNVTFDLLDMDFAATNMPLMYADVIQGNFKGSTVAQVLAEAEKIVGGSKSNYSINEIYSLLTQINENFAEGFDKNKALIANQDNQIKSDTKDLKLTASTNDIRIEWKSYTDNDDYYYVVQKIDINGLFATIKMMNSEETKKKIKYTILDKNPTEGDNTYRIKTFLKNGTVIISEPQTVNYHNLH